MKPGDIATVLYDFHCETTGQRGCVAGQRGCVAGQLVRVTRAFTVNSGDRVSVADPDTGEVLHRQVPLEWLSRGCE